MKDLIFAGKAKHNTLFAEAVALVVIDSHSLILLLFQLLVLKYVINKDVFMRYVNQSYSVMLFSCNFSLYSGSYI